MEDAEKFKTNRFNKTIVCMLPEEKAAEVLEMMGYAVDNKGKLYKESSSQTTQEANDFSNKIKKKTR